MLRGRGPCEGVAWQRVRRSLGSTERACGGAVTEALALVGDAAAPRAVQHQWGLASAVIGAHGVDAEAALACRLLVRALVII